MTPYTLAQRFIGLGEIPGAKNNDFISWAHSLCGLPSGTPDEVPWCSSFVNALAWICALPRSGSPSARSWLKVGRPVDLDEARTGDVVIFKRGPEPQPGPEVIKAQGHVALLADVSGDQVRVIGGNQGDKVSFATFPISSVLGIRRL
jgi:uncharacterized protein (TIGR02594 family)